MPLNDLEDDISDSYITERIAIFMKAKEAYNQKIKAKQWQQN